MKRLVFTGFLLIAALFAMPLFANPPCPSTADDLNSFAACMRPYPNGRGQVLVGSYSAGGMDHHTAGLMNSMHQTVSAPQVMPTIPAAISFASTMAVGAMATYRNPGFYGWYLLGNPLMWGGMIRPPVIYP